MGIWRKLIDLYILFIIYTNNMRKSHKYVFFFFKREKLFHSFPLMRGEWFKMRVCLVPKKHLFLLCKKVDNTQYKLTNWQGDTNKRTIRSILTKMGIIKNVREDKFIEIPVEFVVVLGCDHSAIDKTTKIILKIICKIQYSVGPKWIFIRTFTGYKYQTVYSYSSKNVYPYRCMAL